MNPTSPGVRIAGLVLIILIAGMMLMGGAFKLVVTPSPEMLEGMRKHGLEDNIRLIGFGEVGSALLLLIPWTSPIGVLLTSGFWGGAICLHMSHGEAYLFQASLLLVTWIGAFLRGSVPLFMLK